MEVNHKSNCSILLGCAKRRECPLALFKFFKREASKGSDRALSTKLVFHYIPILQWDWVWFGAKWIRIILQFQANGCFVVVVVSSLEYHFIGG